MVQIMNAMSYDLMVPGNHDFNYGQERLLELEALSDFPYISANVLKDSDATQMFNETHIQSFGDFKVGFFGLTSPETAYKTHPDNVVGITFQDPVERAQAMVDELEGQVDMVVLLAHIGIDESTEVTTEDIAQQVSGIDLIIDGHSHTYLEDGMMVGDTLIVQAGEYGEYLGAVSVKLSGNDFTLDVVNLDSEVPEDAMIQSMINVIALGQDAVLSEKVGSTGVTLDGARALVRTGETNLGNLITDAMLDQTDADVAFTNGGGIRADIPAGDVTLGDVITVLPFGNIIVTIELTGQELLDALEYGTSSAPSSSGKFPHVAGITYTLNLDAAAGSRVSNVLVDGEALDLSATYTVATNDFLAAGGDGYDVFATKVITGEFTGLHQALEQSFRAASGDIEIPSDTRLTINGNE